MDLPLARVFKCEPHTVINFLTMQTLFAAEIHRQLVNVYGAGIMNDGVVREWGLNFLASRKKIHYLPMEERPRDLFTSDAVAGVRALLKHDRRLTIRQLEYLMEEEMCNPTSRSTIHHILSMELDVRKVCARRVPHMLSDTHEVLPVAAAVKFLSQYTNKGESMLDRIIMGDETWTHCYTLPTKAQSKVWNYCDEKAPKKFKAERSVGKVMRTAFWDSKGLIHAEYFVTSFMEKGITAEHYFDNLVLLRGIVKLKWPSLLRGSVLLLRDSVPPHSASLTQLLLRDFDRV